MVSKQKVQTVEEVAQLAKGHPIIGVVDMQNLPAPQLQSLKGSLRGRVVLRMARKRLLKRALDKAGMEKLGERLQGMPALLFTKENPFKLFKILDDSKSNAPAKGGQVAPNDIVVQAGPTPFAPGPVIGELGAIGLKTGVEAGKVAIKEDSVVVKRGETIKPKVAEVLKRLGVEPMEIGLNLIAVLENGTIFEAEQLAIDEEAFEQSIVDAVNWARNLAVETAYPAADVIEIMLSKAFGDAKALALEQGILAADVIEEVLGKVEREALALKDTAGIETVEKLKEEEAAKEEKPETPVKEEEKPEPPEPKKEEKPAEEPKKAEEKPEEEEKNA